MYWMYWMSPSKQDIKQSQFKRRIQRPLRLPGSSFHLLRPKMGNVIANTRQQENRGESRHLGGFWRYGKFTKKKIRKY